MSPEIARHPMKEQEDSFTNFCIADKINEYARLERVQKHYQNHTSKALENSYSIKGFRSLALFLGRISKP